MALGIYAVVVVSLATPLYGPLSSGWALFVLVVAAQLGLGAAIGRAWVLAVPVAVSIIAVLVWGAAGVEWFGVLVGVSVLVACTAVGMGLGRAFPARGDAIAIAFLIVALFPSVWAAAEILRRGPHVPASIQDQLPTDVSLGNLCPGAETSADVERDVRRRAEVLIRELRQRPTEVVTYTVYYEDSDPEHREITVRELAQEQLADMDSNGPGCDPDLERRLRAAM